ncbi:MAG TPA: VOC family protein [Nakamurella sp.]
MAVQLDVIGLVATDMAGTLAFYRRLGLDIPAEADGEPHIEFTLPGGLRLAWDTNEVMASFDPGFQPGRVGNASLAFRADNPASVDRVTST